GRFAHSGMAEQFNLDFMGGDIFAAATDRVLEPVDEMVVAIDVTEERVAGMKPAIAPGIRCRLRIGVVAVVHRPGRFGAQDHLSDLAIPDEAVVLVDEANLDARTRPAADIFLDRVGPRDQRRADFRHVEDCEEIDAEALAYQPPAL